MSRECRHEETETQVTDGIDSTSGLHKTLRFILSQWFLLGYVIVIIISRVAPDVARNGGYLASQYTFSYGALALIFVITGLTMETRQLYRSVFMWRVHIISQGISFVLFPLVVLAIVQCVIASKTTKISEVVLAGIMIMACTPTTIASNVVFTRQAGGDTEAAVIEVLIGNLFGIFVSPALVQLFLRPSLGLGSSLPSASATEIYKQLIKHFGLALYLPLFVGQVIRNLDVELVKKIAMKLHLAKWSSVCLLLLLWATFSDAFASGAFEMLTTQSIIFIVFLNFTLYPFFTAMTFFLCRSLSSKDASTSKRNFLTQGQVIAISFCGPQKSVPVGLVLINLQYTASAAVLSIPLAIYQAFQIFLAQGFVVAFQHWLKHGT